MMASNQDGFFANIKESLNNSQGWPHSAIPKDQDLLKAYDGFMNNKSQQQTEEGMNKAHDISVNKNKGIKKFA